MKNLCCFLILMISLSGYSQQQIEEQETQKVIEDFFVAFHAQNAEKLTQLAHPLIAMQSIAVDDNGDSQLSVQDYGKFVSSITSRPESMQYEEILHGFNFEINGVLANVVTPYSFYLNGKLSHCGVNSFQLMKTSGEWKIIHIVDTRTKQNCEG